MLLRYDTQRRQVCEFRRLENRTDPHIGLGLGSMQKVFIWFDIGCVLQDVQLFCNFVAVLAGTHHSACCSLSHKSGAKKKKDVVGRFSCSLYPPLSCEGNGKPSHQ